MKTETDTQTDRQVNRYRQIGRQKERHTDRQTDKQKRKSLRLVIGSWQPKAEGQVATLTNKCFSPPASCTNDEADGAVEEKKGEGRRELEFEGTMEGGCKEARKAEKVRQK